MKNADGTGATFNVDSLMPERVTVYFRARLIDAFGTVVAQTTAQHPVRSWLRLVSPIHGPTTVVATQSPEFIWSSPAITFPPGLWQYDISVFNTQTGRRDFFKDRPQRHGIHVHGTAGGQYLVHVAGPCARGELHGHR